MEKITSILILVIGCAFLVANATDNDDNQLDNNPNVQDIGQKMYWPGPAVVIIASGPPYINIPQLGYRDSSYLDKQVRYQPWENIRQIKRKRRGVSVAEQAMGAAQANGAMNGKPVGSIDPGSPTLSNGYYNDPRNFGGRIGGSVGTKVYESPNGRHTVGVGLAGQTNAGLNGGRPYANNPGIGVGAGYQYRWRRSADDKTKEVHVPNESRQRRQSDAPAQETDFAQTSDPDGQHKFEHPALTTGQFSDRVGESVRVNLWEYQTDPVRVATEYEYGVKEEIQQ